MKILVIGGGGREHALAWKIAQNKEVSRVYVAPGNAGTATNPDMVNVPISNVVDLVKFAQDEQIYLTVVGPEAPLSVGMVDAFRAANLKIFGPTKLAAQLEGSYATLEAKVAERTHQLALANMAQRRFRRSRLPGRQLIQIP